MANKHETLASLFTDTADAIREITGTSEKIIADNFPDIIREISVGIDTSDATIEAAEVMNNEIAYGKDGQIVGTAPFEHNRIITQEKNIETWTEVRLPFSSYWQSIAYGDGKFVAVGFAHDEWGAINVAAYSEDGIDWNIIELPVSAGWSYVTYGGGKFVAVAVIGQNWEDSNIAIYSEDGINWTQTELPASAEWKSVAYGDGKFVAIDSYDTNIAAYSEDGINWTQTELPVTASWQSVTYGDGKFVAVAYGYFAAYSTDGINWV